MKRFPLLRTFALAALVVSGLLVLGFVPDWGVAGWEARPVDMLSDLKPADSTAMAEEAPVIEVSADSCKPGVTCIADYVSEGTENMGYFYAALNEAAIRPVRIAFIGDSFVEGDILTDALRDSLQACYGGMGVGYVTLDHVAVAGRQTIRQTRSGWAMHSAVDKQYEASLPDLSGYYFLSQGAASVTLSGNGEYSGRLARAEVSQFLLATRGMPVTVTASTESGQTRAFTAAATNALQAVTFEAQMEQVRWDIAAASGIVGYGVTMDGRTGVALDNLSLRGSTGLPLMAVPAGLLAALNSVRHYDLVVLQYGLNVMLRGKTDYSAYASQLEHIISHLREAMPQTAFLVVGIGDRGGKLRTGELGTLPEIAPLLEAQAAAAASAGVAFWNTFEAMGGSGAMVRFAQDKPAKAAKDYTHISEEGGRFVAQKLFDAIRWGHQLYNMKHQ